MIPNMLLKYTRKTATFAKAELYHAAILALSP